MKMVKRFILFFSVVLCIANLTFAQAPGCPNVTIDAPGITQGQVTIPCNDCVTLSANVLVTGLTNTYTVSSIPYAPPYPYNSGNPVFVNQDDIWSPVVTIPFDFCYFGNYYTQLVTGANGVITFDLSNANGYCPWSFSASCPSPALILNAIFGPYHDIDPYVGGAIYQGVLGSYPCRTFVMNFNQVPMYSGTCNYMLATHQIVLYEATNVIEVYIQNAPLCSSWNSGNKVIGIQNATGTVGYTPPGRNTGPWSATNEAWRFTPNGGNNYTIQWYQGPVPVGNTPSITVCPTVQTTYTAIATYDNCNYTQVVVTDNVTVNITDLILSIDPITTEICEGDSASITISAVGTAPYVYDWSPVSGLSGTTDSVVMASPSSTTTYVVTVTDANTCTGTINTTITVNSLPVVTADASPNPICEGESSTVSALGAQSYTWNNLGNGSTHTVTPYVTTDYTVTGTDANGCTSSAEISLIVFEAVTAAISNPASEICEGESVTITASGGSIYEWNTSETTDQITVTPTTTTDYQVTVSSDDGCSATASTGVMVHCQPVAEFSVSKKTGCVPLNTTFSEEVDCYDPITTYLWSFGAGGSYGTATDANPSKIFSQPGNYDVSLFISTDYGCSDSITKTEYIEAYPNPIAEFMADPMVAELGTTDITFIDQSTGATIWNWDFGDGNTSIESNPLHFYTLPGNFRVILTVQNEYGCSSSTYKYVQITQEISFYMPNAFTPGNDGLNDTFGPSGVGIKDIRFYVYDRWGKLVFYSDQLNKRWDGRINGKIPTATGIYSWRAEVTYANNIKENFAGNVILFR